MIDITNLKKEIQQRGGKGKKESNQSSKKLLNDMTVSEIIRYVDERRRPLIEEDEYRDYNIPAFYSRIDLHNSFELIIYSGNARFTSEEYKQIDYFTIQLKIYYTTMMKSYNKSEKKQEVEINALLYLNVLKKIEDFVKYKRQEVEKDLSSLKILVPNKKKNLPNYLYPLKKMYQFSYSKDKIESIKHFAKFLAETVQEVQFYGTILKLEEMDSLNIILEASQNVKYSSMTKKSLTNRFYEFLCSVAELKHISRGDELLCDKIEKG